MRKNFNYFWVVCNGWRVNRRLRSLDTSIKRRGDQKYSKWSKESLDDQVFKMI